MLWAKSTETLVSTFSLARWLVLSDVLPRVAVTGKATPQTQCYLVLALPELSEVFRLPASWLAQSTTFSTSRSTFVKDRLQTT